MATITNQNETTRDPNAPVQKSTANAAMLTQSANVTNGVNSSGVPVGSGQFSTLQKYLSANKDAGSRINQQLGGTLSREATASDKKSEANIGASNTANNAFAALTEKTQGLTSDLSQGQTTTTVDPKQNYSADAYGVTLSGQQAMQDIASNQDRLNEFTDIRTDAARAKQNEESNKAANEAYFATQNQKALNEQRQQDIARENRRQQLLADILGTQNQRAGVKALDNAFLSLDKNNTLNQTTNTLRSNVAGIKDRMEQAQLEAARIPGLNTDQQAAQTGLTDRLAAMQKEYQDILDARVGDLNTGKEKYKNYLSDAFARMQQDGTISKELYEALQMGNVLSADDLAKGNIRLLNPTTPVDPRFNDVSTGKIDRGQLVDQNGNPVTPTSSFENPQTIRFFNELDGKTLNDFLDTGLLDQRAGSREAVLNQNDIDKLKMLDLLTGNTNNDYKLSDFRGKQYGESTLDEALNTRAQNWADQDIYIFSEGTGYKSEGRNDGGTSSATADAIATIGDILYGDGIARNVNSSTSGNWLENNLLPIMTGGLNGIILNGVLNPTPMQSDPSGATYGQMTPEMYNALKEQLRANGYAGGMETRYHGSRDEGAARTLAEDQAVQAVKANLNRLIDQLGYRNVATLDDGEYNG